MALLGSDVRAIVDRVCTRPDVLDACGRRDLGEVVAALCSADITQGQIAALTGFSQGRLSEWMTGKRAPKAATTFEKFSNGLSLPAAARRALGVTLDSSSPAIADMLDVRAGLSYPETAEQSAESLSVLWQADLADVAALQRSRVDPRAWTDASLRWLLDGGSVPGQQPARGIHIGLADVARFRATVDLFAELDDRFGGGHAREALIQYLRTDADRLLRGRYSDDAGRELFAAVGEATLLAAWMSYDSAPASALAQGYFVQALALAQAGGDRLLGASILNAMSHQATFTGRFTEAANLARAALTGTRGIATATLTAHFHAMEARALARLTDAKSCARALSESVSKFERANSENDPQWIRYFDESELSAEFGHCMRDLGRATDAVSYAVTSLKASGESAFGRSDFFVSLVLADSYLAAGDAEQACSVALRALQSGEQIRSARCVSYLREFGRHLPAHANGAVAEFRERAAQSRSWRIASRPDKGVD
jgi:transcriptional regulator with XRE-family HTH domain/tetratricopeptide (TPR) repeat protein